MKKGSVVINWMRCAWLTLALCFLPGCADEPEHGEHQGHAHHAPHGGALGMLGNHAFQLEVVVNEAAERLELYVLDGEAERFVRVVDAEIPARGVAGEREWDLRFVAMANQATGETKGDSAQFAAEAKGLVAEPQFEIRFDRLELLGQVFEAVTIPYPEGSH